MTDQNGTKRRYISTYMEKTTHRMVFSAKYKQKIRANKVNVVQSWMGEEDAIMVTILNLPTNKVTQRAVKCEINKVVLILLLSKCHCQQSWEIKGLCIYAQKRNF